MIQLPEGFDSIFRYIVVVSQRAEQLVTGAKTRTDSRFDKSTLIAIDEVDEGKVDWRVLTQEELDAQRQAIVDQLRAEVGVTDAETAPGAPIPDVLPTGDAVPVEVPAAAEGDGERDDELMRLQKLLGMAAVAEQPEEGEEEAAAAEGKAEEPVTIDLEEAAEELEGKADEEEEEES